MRSRKLVVLIVEDESLVRMLAVIVAEDNGFEALSAATADEGLKSSNPAPMFGWSLRT